MMFKDRHDAGKKLVSALIKYKDGKDVIVIGLPRGGVVTAYEVAVGLHVPLDVICPRKVGAPHNQELAIGAVTETGIGFFNTELIEQLGVSQEYLDTQTEVEKKRAEDRWKLYRKTYTPIELQNKTVILVDDGIATGATMKASIQSVKAKKAKKVVVAVPVSPPDTLRELQRLADEVVFLDAPYFFQAVGQFYYDFTPTSDEEVMQLLHEIQK